MSEDLWILRAGKADKMNFFSLHVVKTRLQKTFISAADQSVQQVFFQETCFPEGFFRGTENLCRSAEYLKQIVYRHRSDAGDPAEPEP